MPSIGSKYFALLNVQHIPSSVGKNEKNSMHGFVSPNQLQSMTMSEQEGAVYHSWKLIICFQIPRNL